MNKDIQILRNLAGQYAEIANNPINQVRMILHRAVNDLKPIRPIVLIKELPWNELSLGNQELEMKCCDPDYREVEWFMKKELFQWRYFPADMIVRPFYGVEKLIHSTGTGYKILDEHTESFGDSICSHKYINQIKNEDSLLQFHNETIIYREAETLSKYIKIASAIGDIIPVKVTGIITGYEIGCKNWDVITQLMGAENLLYALADEPDLMHKLVVRLTDIFLDSVRQYEELNLFEPNQIYIHETAALNSTLNENIDYNHVTAKNMWGRGLAQIFASVSKDMRDEFDIQYMKRAMEPFGLVYYGCCEPLHNMIDILSEIPNLRKISITPWADVDVAAEAIGRKYVLASKPNPAFILDAINNEAAIKDELQKIVSAIKRNQCACDIVLKDISSINGKLENIMTWERLAMESIQI